MSKFEETSEVFWEYFHQSEFPRAFVKIGPNCFTKFPRNFYEIFEYFLGYSTSFDKSMRNEKIFLKH